MSVRSSCVEPALAIMFVMPIAMLLIHVPVVFWLYPVNAVVEFYGVMLTVLAGDVIRPARGCRKLI
jgi:hypothetical protein